MPTLPQSCPRSSQPSVGSFPPRRFAPISTTLERMKFLAPPEPEIAMEDEEEEEDDEPWPAHPVLGAQELLRFSRIRQLLQP